MLFQEEMNFHGKYILMILFRVSLPNKKLKSRISFWDEVEKEKEFSLEEAEKREKGREDFKEWVDLEEVSWR